ncbi:MAG: hypothetical protein ACYDCI_00365 [Candidatus Limnocylindrales bacterium]
MILILVMVLVVAATFAALVVLTMRRGRLEPAMVVDRQSFRQARGASRR